MVKVGEVGSRRIGATDHSLRLSEGEDRRWRRSVGGRGRGTGRERYWERDRGLKEEFGLAVGEIGVPCRPWADWVGDGPCVVAGEGCMADGSEDGRGDVGAHMPIT